MKYLITSPSGKQVTLESDKSLAHLSQSSAKISVCDANHGTLAPGVFLALSG